MEFPIRGANQRGSKVELSNDIWLIVLDMVLVCACYIEAIAIVAI
jgi:hypothetical protein